jgi:hypothetical protein
LLNTSVRTRHATAAARAFGSDMCTAKAGGTGADAASAAGVNRTTQDDSGRPGALALAVLVAAHCEQYRMQLTKMARKIRLGESTRIPHFVFKNMGDMFAYPRLEKFLMRHKNE